MPYADPERQRAYFREANRRWYEANRERKLAATKANYQANRAVRLAQSKARREDPAKRERWRECIRLWQEAHPDKVKEGSRRYREAHPERAAAARRAWAAAHPDLVVLASMRRRALKRSAPGTCSREQMASRIAMFGGKCWVPGCGHAYEAMDHVIALSRGGTNWPANLRPICRFHNSQKHNREWRAFLAEVMGS